MAGHESKLFIVEKCHNTFLGAALKLWVFRTRKAARQFVEYKSSRTKKFKYNLVAIPTTWGPDN